MAITAFPINTVLPTANVVTNTAYKFMTATNVQASLQQIVDKSPTILNVKDFGAVGDFTHDDTPNIQAAIDAALAAPTGTSRTVYFPPGRYKITSTLTMPGDGGSITLQGDTTTIEGNFAGWLIDRSGGQPERTIKIRDISFTNGLSGSGIRYINTAFSHVANCSFLVGQIGIQMDNSCFCPTISNVKMRRNVPGGVNSPSSSIGINLSSGGGGSIRDFDIGGFNIAVIAHGTIVSGGRMEQNGTGIQGGGIIMGCNFEANNIQIEGSALTLIHCTGLGDNFSAWALTTTGNWTIGSPIVSGIPDTSQMYGGAQYHAGNAALGLSGDILTVDSPTQITLDTNATQTQTGASFDYHIPSTHGVKFTGGFNTVINTHMGGPFSVGAFAFDQRDIGNWTTQPGATNVFIRCQGDNSLPGKPAYVLPCDLEDRIQPQGTFFIGCSDSPNVACKFAQLPESGNMVEGTERDITDSNTNVWGATVAGGGSNHVKVRYNGSNWTVVGK